MKKSYLSILILICAFSLSVQIKHALRDENGSHVI